MGSICLSLLEEEAMTELTNVVPSGSFSLKVAPGKDPIPATEEDVSFRERPSKIFPGTTKSSFEEDFNSNLKEGQVAGALKARLTLLYNMMTMM